MIRWCAVALCLIGTAATAFAQPAASLPPAEALPELVAPPPPAASPMFDWSKFKIGGQYRIPPNASDFGFHSRTIGDEQATSYLVLQRMRLTEDREMTTSLI